jgi:hypothetical protein
MPYSRKIPRMWLFNAIRWRTNNYRLWCRCNTARYSGVLAATKRILGLCTASQIDSASLRSFCCSSGRVSQTSGLSGSQCGPVALGLGTSQASMPIKQGCRRAKNRNISLRFNDLRTTNSFFLIDIVYLKYIHCQIQIDYDNLLCFLDAVLLV